MRKQGSQQGRQGWIGRKRRKKKGRFYFRPCQKVDTGMLLRCFCNKNNNKVRIWHCQTLSVNYFLCSKTSIKYHNKFLECLLPSEIRVRDCVSCEWLSYQAFGLQIEGHICYLQPLIEESNQLILCVRFSNLITQHLQIQMCPITRQL